MCSLENAIETIEKSVFVSHEVFKILVDEYRKAHTEDAVTALLDDQDLGVASEEDIITLLKAADTTIHNTSYISNKKEVNP